MIQYQDWTEAYKEMCKIIRPDDPEDLTGIPEIKHMDLWHEQTDHLEEEYPWPSDSIFFNFNCNETKTIGKKVQECPFKVDIIYALDTIADTYHGSETQAVSLQFMAICKKIHKLFQGRSGVHFSSMDRSAIRRVPAHPELMVISQTYEVIIMDYSAMDEPGEATVTTATVTSAVAPGQNPDHKLFDVEL